MKTMELEELQVLMDKAVAGKKNWGRWMAVQHVAKHAGVNVATATRMLTIALICTAAIGMEGCATLCQVADGVGPAPIVQDVACRAAGVDGFDGRQSAR